DGLTPSVAQVRQARAGWGRRDGLLVMLRDHADGFAYDAEDVAQMARAMPALHDAGAGGFVFGAVRDGRVDEPAVRRVVAEAGRLGVPVTFHRAFDALEDPVSSVDLLAAIGIRRILTSGVPWGHAGSAVSGLERIRATVARAAGRLEIVIGGGVSAENAPALVAGLAGVSVHAYSSVRAGGQVDAGRVRALVDAVSV
ncbi:MAG: copper homeostasis protein CutC, partial [Pseudomonadota bacterium]